MCKSVTKQARQAPAQEPSMCKYYKPGWTCPSSRSSFRPFVLPQGLLAKNAHKFKPQSWTGAVQAWCGILQSLIGTRRFQRYEEGTCWASEDPAASVLTSSDLSCISPLLMDWSEVDRPYSCTPHTGPVSLLWPGLTGGSAVTQEPLPWISAAAPRDCIPAPAQAQGCKHAWNE